MAETWTCRVCNTVNEEDSESCMVCRTGKPGTAPVELPASEAPWGLVFPEEVPLPPPPPADAAPVGVPTADSAPADGAEAELLESPLVMSRGHRSRRIATGMVLGIGHVGLFVAAFVFLLAEIGVGQWVLRLAYFAIASIPAWQAGPIIHQAIVLQDVLPLSVVKWPYLLLAVACLVMRLVRRMPGPLSLAIAIPAALYGVLIAISELPVFIDCWLLALPALIGSCVVVAKTLPEPLV